MFAGIVGWHTLIVVGVALMFVAIIAAVVVVVLVVATRARGGAPGTVVAGWYPDPSGGGTRRYWDGIRWTAHTDPAPPAGDA